MSEDPRLERIRSLVRDVPDFPKPGILFKDITPVLADGGALTDSMDLLAEMCEPLRPEVIAAPEARGFIFGAALAERLKIGFVPLRKRGKLPWRTIEESYDLEYGEDVLAVHEDAFREGRRRTVIVDDLLATGGTIGACRKLVEKAGGEVVAAAFLIELEFLDGRFKIEGVPIEALLRY